MDSEIVAVPTETVYGLAANALDPWAIEKIFIAKKRPKDNPLIVHIGVHDDIEKYAQNIPKTAYVLAKAFWPGPLTMILKKKSCIPDAVSAGQNTVGLRIPNHPLLQELLALLPFPLAAPSANQFMYVSPVNAEHVLWQLDGRIPYILDGGRCEHGIESTIITFEGENPVLLRAGAIDSAMITSALGNEVIDRTKQSHIKRAGMYQKHYSPHTPFFIGTYEEQGDRSPLTGYLTFSRVLDVPTSQQHQLSPSGDMTEAAHNLYYALHELDRRGFEKIIAELLPDTGIGAAINERLKKAANMRQ